MNSSAGPRIRAGALRRAFAGQGDQQLLLPALSTRGCVRVSVHVKERKDRGKPTELPALSTRVRIRVCVETRKGGESGNDDDSSVPALSEPA